MRRVSGYADFAFSNDTLHIEASPVHAVRVKNKYAQAVQLACDQGGVVTREQLLDLEISPSAIDRRARSFEWDRIHRSIYEIMTMQDVKSRLRAAVVILPTAVVSHESAAEVHGISH